MANVKALQHNADHSAYLSSFMAKEVTKNEIKHTIKTKIREECIKRMQEGSKSKDRVDLNPDETQYLQRLPLSNCRVYFR